MWDHARWGSYDDPIHKSDLNGIIGKFGCTEQFRRKKIERATGKRTYENASGKLCAGNAVHNVIARVLRSEPARAVVLNPELGIITEESLRISFEQEFEKERAGRPVDWWKQNADTWKREQVKLLFGLMQDMHNHVGEVVLVEAGFIYALDGVWLTGMTDLVYRAPGSDKISFCDWKSGAQKPHQIDLDHGWEGGIYSAALKHAWFIPGENVVAPPGIEHRDAVESACIEVAQLLLQMGDPARQPTLPGIEDLRADLQVLVAQYKAHYFGEFPDQIRYVFLRDYIPYAKGGSKTPARPEDLAFHGLTSPAKVKYSKGETRGPAWLHVQRRESDIQRLRNLLSAVVSWVRHGKFAAAPGEMCTRCKFRTPCLNDGYQPTGTEAAQLDVAIEALYIGDAADVFDGGLSDLDSV